MITFCLKAYDFRQWLDANEPNSILKTAMIYHVEKHNKNIYL